MNDQSEASSEAPSHRSECVVMKFGGTSVEDAAAIRRLCRLVARPSPQLPVVVVSALAKVTDQLLHAGWMAAGGHLESAGTIFEVLRQRHECMARELVEGPEAIRLLNEFANEFKALDKMLVAIASEKALSPRSQDRLLGAGESLSSKLVCSGTAVRRSTCVSGGRPRMHRHRRRPHPGHATLGRNQRAAEIRSAAVTASERRARDGRIRGRHP